MAVKTYTWVSLWFLLTAPVILWDAGYCFMRPRSMIGGDLHWFWEPYTIYQKVHLLYGVLALEKGEGFTNAQALMNVIETFLNFLYLYLAHFSEWPPAALIGLTSSALTLAKTILYYAQEYYCNYCTTGHNDWQTLVSYWIFPNVFWIIVPSFIIYVLGRDICAQLTLADKAAEAVTADKKQ
ncbi:hypothetical protein GYMLUDRAFT_51132 [Collybiopsis luxurians FD-317 M1]|uniref:EXPERA domain-containing protein n=1 Tax=Collybiopsis luxurians FD-317 M1 TaxID=944289 RepID=A0A0D0C747_9AGAR|nr:hypothetical protein GYMLUDRAFT_51132 [Collybiopsis luxurians FD-317 M1]